MTARPALLPRPLEVETTGTAGARFAGSLALFAEEGAAAEARLLRRLLEASSGWPISLTVGGEPAGHADVELRLGEVGLPAHLDGEVPAACAGERYRLEAAAGRVVVTGSGRAGLFYGLQTLRQLLPDDWLRAAPASGRPAGPVELPGLTVVDGPRFAWRGVHLDVARNFFPARFVLRLIDLAALHKCNVVHLHLTDDQGWRVPIEAYPRLVEVGSWRRESPAGREPGSRGDGRPHGGSYTRAELAEIVGYAAERHVTVVPEIDMPGHLSAAIAAYPELGGAGRPIEVRTRWGISRHVLDLGPASLEFCRTVVDEVAELFPGPYLHVGGDECPTDEWEASETARARLAELGSVDPRRLQGWFTAEMAAHVARRGRRLVGWDEIVDAGAPEGAVVMAWRSTAHGHAAARAGLPVVMAPLERCYFDWAAAEGPDEPTAIFAPLPLEQVYGFDPAPAQLEPDARARVLGTQAQLWTEFVSTPEHAEYQYFPRLAALAEVAWSSPSAGGWSFEEFTGRLTGHLGRLDALGVNYRPLSGPTPAQRGLGLARDGSA